MKELRIPEYGVGADVPALRRGRWSFRFGVAAVVLLTFSLWLSERYLRFDLNETQYIMALTMHPDSARPVLRNVLKRETDSGQPIVARHAEALADVEEPDILLARYAEAYQLDPGNWSLVLNYGTRLWGAGKFAEARERFREASVHAPDNALPRYLEAAALVLSRPDNPDYAEAMALIERANVSGYPARFPTPLWHVSIPASGNWYAQKQRLIIDRCCAPLYRFNAAMVAAARASADDQTRVQWETWFETMERMGQNLVGDVDTPAESLGAPQAVAGLNIQIDAIDSRLWLADADAAEPDPALSERKGRLLAAKDKLAAFEDARQNIIGAHQQVILAPVIFALTTFLLFLAVWTLALLIDRIFWKGSLGENAQHALWGNLWFGGAGAGFLALYIAFAFLQHVHPIATQMTMMASLIWMALVAVLLAGAPVYPYILLPSARSRIDALAIAEDDKDTAHFVRRARLDAYLSLMRRYLGIALGVFLIASCTWFLGVRIVTGLYPTQVELMASGLRPEEIALITEIIRLTPGLS
ncbi:MAG: hypothetical protein GC168_04290 [Candidatus Hydrogenedens sp.]|nr:hypothetical protein [Candidatus Hydrogenedens sp.]